MYLSRVDGVSGYEVDGSTVDFRVELESTHELQAPESDPHTLTVVFYDTDVVNVFFSPNTTRDEYIERLSLGIDRESLISDDTLDVSVTEDSDEIRVETDSLALVVDTTDGNFRLVGDEGIITETSAATDARDQYLTKPLGYSEAEVENWPLKVEETHLSLRLSPDESVYGFGEEFGTLDKRGRTVEATVKQALGVSSAQSYKSVPYFLSTRGYGVFVETSTSVSFDIGATAAETLEITPASDALSLTFVASGAPKPIVRKYTTLTGRADPLPKWAYGVWMSRNSYEDAQEVRDVADRLQEEGIHCDVLHIDPSWMGIDDSFELAWDDTTFPDPAGLLADLSDEGFHVSLWEYPYLHRGTEPFETARREGYLVQSPENRPYILRRLSSNSIPYTQVGIVDFTDQEAVEWWAEQHEALVETGVDAFKLDFGEYFPTDGVASDGRTGATLHNLFPSLYADAVSEAFKTTEKEPVLWNRAAWLGSQRYPVHWGGDPESSYDGLAASFRGGLSLGISGFQYWSCDIGGYSGDPSAELYVRWLQWAVLATSNPRFHGKTPREPWAFGERALRIARRYITERYELLPYIYSLATEASHSGLPLLRPMFLEFPNAEFDLRPESQCMLGDALLFAPVLDPGGTVTIALPKGTWIDYWTGERVLGGQTLELQPDLEELPAFLRGGRLVVKRDDPGDATAMLPATLRLALAPTDCGPTTDSFTHATGVDEEKTDIELSVGPDANELQLTTGSHLPVDRVVVVLPGVESAPDSVVVNGSDVGFTTGESSTAPPGVQVAIDEAPPLDDVR